MCSNNIRTDECAFTPRCQVDIIIINSSANLRFFSAASANNTIASYGLAHGEHNTLYYYYIGVCVYRVLLYSGAYTYRRDRNARMPTRPPPQIHIRAQYFSISLKSPQKNHVPIIIIIILNIINDGSCTCARTSSTTTQ